MTPAVRTESYLGGKWQPGQGPVLESTSPSDESLLWQGQSVDAGQVATATAAAREALSGWWNTSLADRVAVIERFADMVKARKDELARLISHEVGKPLWEAKTEAGAVAAKAGLSIEALRERRAESTMPVGDQRAVTRYKPFGVLAVLGPFNFPVHLANGHIIPALLAGNTVVFKPSELAPACGAWMVERWEEAGLPAGVINLIQGGRAVGETLASDPQLDGLLFTGSSAAGRALHQLFGQWPQKMLALEMGGNNPLVVHSIADHDAAALEVLQSAYLSAGQRCTCARRLILTPECQPDAFLDVLNRRIAGIRSGLWTDDPEPFHGPVIHAGQARRLLDEQERLIAAGAESLRAMTLSDRCAALVTPGLLDVSKVAELGDEEMFGPMLQVIRVDSLEQAIEVANDTAYGLSAGLLGDDRSAWDYFIHNIRAGVVNWNRQTTGASGKLPFGGCGLSGNNRPSGYFAIDYCNWPVASMENDQLSLPDSMLPGLVWE